jgi:transposase
LQIIDDIGMKQLPRRSGEPCRKALTSLREHWTGLTLFLDDPRIPLDNNYGERLMRNPALGRKNYYGSGAEWSGRLAMMMFSIMATLNLANINPRLWLTWYLQACAERRNAPKIDVRMESLRRSTPSARHADASPDTS